MGISPTTQPGTSGKPSYNVVLEGEEESFSVKYLLVPMFLRAKERLEPTEKMTPTREARTLERGSDPMAEMMTEIMMKTRAASMKEEKTGSDILIRWVREAELTARI